MVTNALTQCIKVTLEKLLGAQLVKK